MENVIRSELGSEKQGRAWMLWLEMYDWSEVKGTDLDVSLHAD